MANWSDTYITLSGNRLVEAIDKLKKDIHDEYLHDDISGRGMSIDSPFDEKEDEIVISGSGRWAGPDGYFKRLCEEYELSCLYKDAEVGCNFAYLFEYEAGILIREEEDTYFSDIGVEIFGIEYFIECYEYITDEKNWEHEYRDVIATFQKHGKSLEELRECWKVKIV